MIKDPGEGMKNAKTRTLLLFRKLFDESTKAKFENSLIEAERN